MANNDQSDLGGNTLTGNAAQRIAGRGGVDSRELPILDGSPLLHFATNGAAANAAAPAAPRASGESPPPAQPARETQAKESTIDRLRREITEHVAAKRSLKTELEQSAARIADFIVALAERDAAVAQGSRTLEEFKQASVVLQSRLASSAATVEQLTNVVEQDRLAAADAARRYEEQVAASNELSAKIQQLESHLDRSNHEQGTQIAAHTQATERLTLRIRELERDLAQLTDRDRQRDAAHEELQDRLAKQIAMVMQLRSELGKASTSSVELRAQLAHREELLAPLERNLVSRDQTIADLEETLLRTRRKMETAQHAGESTLAARVIELEKTLAERRAHDGRLQTSRAAADHALREARHRIAKLEHQVRGAAKETTKLKEEMAAREQLVEHFKGSTEKLGRLDVSLQDLDRKLSSVSTQISSAQLRLHALRNNARAVKPVDAVSVAPETLCHRMIVAVDGEGRVKYPLRANDITIGRAPECDIRIRRDYVSRTHARILMRGDSTFIEDLDSTNGVFVNYKAIKQRTELHDGDHIGLGDFINSGAVPELKYVDLHRPPTSGRTTPASTVRRA